MCLAFKLNVFGIQKGNVFGTQSECVWHSKRMCFAVRTSV